ncbi:hypothetical protein SLEP1_g50241 [Rubroshorea leprosula]|uniref:Uncharacterized protein n=1 Tax=Rubroshorea leprosula TaxID=152421 RepID=A0AAV5M1E7_9ROSI|nr:hypothetical protein SLEP1_g50241 [Rubroshorea leprosula]
MMIGVIRAGAEVKRVTLGHCGRSRNWVAVTEAEVKCNEALL